MPSRFVSLAFLAVALQATAVQAATPPNILLILPDQMLASAMGCMGNPFFLTVQMGPPHDPYGAPEKYMKLYDPEKLTLPPNSCPGSPSRSCEVRLPCI